MRIEHLTDHPEAIPTIARWHVAEWGHHSPRRSLATARERLRNHLSRERIPLTMVALAGATPVGSAALVCRDMVTRPQLTPWLADVVVDPAHRGRGIGSALVQRMVEKGRELGVGTLYLFTPDRERLYARLGWSLLERTDYRGEGVAVMRLELG